MSHVGITALSGPLEKINNIILFYKHPKQLKVHANLSISEIIKPNANDSIIWSANIFDIPTKDYCQ